jgi:transcriptional regulator with XRE-family HTH domain
MDMRRLIGQNVKRLRRRKGLTQEQYAEISGFSQQYISGLEQGLRNPTVVTVYELATALGVSHLDLMRPPQSGRRT